MALIYEPFIFKKLPGIRAALSLRGISRRDFANNMSLSVGDDETTVLARRARLARTLGFTPEALTTQRQVHGRTVVEVTKDHRPTESDAMITTAKGTLLAVSVADCVPVLLADLEHEAIGAVHSGWRGTVQNIAAEAIAAMRSRYGTRPEAVLAYIGASAGQCCYEVRSDVADRFKPAYSRALGGDRYLFDNRGVVLDQLLAAGVRNDHIELDIRCTICSPQFHSYRRDGSRSGRMLAVIGLKCGRGGDNLLETA